MDFWSHGFQTTQEISARQPSARPDAAVKTLLSRLSLGLSQSCNNRLYSAVTQVSELLDPQGAGIACLNAVARPQWYIADYSAPRIAGLRIPAEQLTFDCRGRLHAHLDSSGAACSR